MPKGDILIDGTKIAAVDRDLGAVDANVIDGTDFIAIPASSTLTAIPGRACCATRRPIGRSASISRACAA